MSDFVCLHGFFSLNLVLLETGIVLCAHLAEASKVRLFFFFFLGCPMGGHEGREKKRGRTMTGVSEKEKDGQC